MKKCVILLVLFLVGCASGPLGRLPIIENQSQAGDVYVIRKSNFFGAAVSYRISVDKQDIFGIRSGEYTKFRLVSGEHAIAVKYTGGGREGMKIFSLAPQQEVYFITGPIVSGSQGADIVQLSPDEGKEWIKKSKYVIMPE